VTKRSLTGNITTTGRRKPQSSLKSVNKVIKKTINIEYKMFLVEYYLNYLGSQIPFEFSHENKWDINKGFNTNVL